MARLNEPPVSTDSLETLRKKLLRQNRDLAKSNNVRALRIRELENECAAMLSENLELRGRILELEKEVEDNEARRIADHAMVIREKLEAQLTEWGTLLAGLGLEPPMKRHSPRANRRRNKPRLSFSSARPSPSQRRLRDIARDIEELGSISESKSYTRMSLNPEQILALRNEADSFDSIESPELNPPSMSQLIEEDPVKVDSPTRPPPAVLQSPAAKVAPPETLASPQTSKAGRRPPSPEKQEAMVLADKVKAPQPALSDKPVQQAAKIGSKRKLAARDDMVTVNSARASDENQLPQSLAGKPSIREKAGGKTLKELASMRKESREKAAAAAANARRPLQAKNSNEDFASPKKTTKPTMKDEVVATKADLAKTKIFQEQQKREKPKPKPKAPTLAIESVLEAQVVPPTVVSMPSELGTSIAEPSLPSLGSPEADTAHDGACGGTSPPADGNANQEPSRPSRRSRAAVSYAEPNLRDKMRRPTKELCDAVAGEGRNARRSSQAEPPLQDLVKVKRESEVGESWKALPSVSDAPASHTGENAPASPLANRGPSKQLDRPKPSLQDESGRAPAHIRDLALECSNAGTKSTDQPRDSTGSIEVGIYEFTTSSPQAEEPAPLDAKKRPPGRRASRRVSSAVQTAGESAVTERSSTRRRSMMV